MYDSDGILLMRRSNCSDPIPPPGDPGDITFFGVAQVSLSLYICLASPYVNTLINLFSSDPHFSSDPGFARGVGVRTI